MKRILTTIYLSLTGKRGSQTSPLEVFFETIQKTSEKSAETLAKIDGVMVHARARQIINQKNWSILLNIIFSFPLKIFSDILSLIFYPFSNTLKFLIIISAAVSFYFIEDFFQIDNLIRSFFAFSLFLLFYGLKEFLSSIRAIFINFLDVILFGRLTKIYCYFVVNSGRVGCELMVSGSEKWFQPRRLAVDFFLTRLPYIPDPRIQPIEDEFHDIARLESDERKIEERCSVYWQKYSDNKKSN